MPGEIMILPGQTGPASEKFNEAVASIQKTLGRKIVFMPLEGSHSALLKSNIGGFHQSSGGTESIWLDASLPAPAAEATAAHELGHTMQSQEGYPRVSSVNPALSHLANRINDLVMDESADLWAIGHGFDMSEAFGKVGLRNLINHISRQAVNAEPADWDAYLGFLRKMAIQGKNAEHADLIELPPEAGTQVMILDYAGLSLRLGRYGLFKDLDSVWATHWPISRRMGKELLGLLGEVRTRAECREALEKIISYLKIPSKLLKISS